MKIQNISIKNYKAFYGEYSFDVSSENLLIYGENGSGKSSLYYALKDFFQSSMEAVNMNAVENVFLQEDEKGKGYIKVTFDTDTTEELNHTTKPTDGSIKEASYLKSFLTYKHLLGVHYVKINDEINLFDLLVKGVLKHYNNEDVTGGRELGELWQDVINAYQKPKSGRTYDKREKRKDLTTVLKTFNDAFRQLFDPNNPVYILKEVAPILENFYENLNLKITYKEAIPNGRLDGVKQNHVSLEVKIKHFSESVEKPHFFLNEAKLSAIAISIYLGMVKQHAQKIPLKVLFLDDIFIGLDMSNRLPLLKILQEEFTEYQIFMTTYDRNWFEVAKKHLGEKHWKTIEMYVGKQGAFDVPVVIDPSENYLQKATKYYETKDYPACSNYLRKEIEKLIKDRLPEEVIRIFEGKPHTLTYLWGKFVSRYSGLGVTISEDVKKSLETSLLTLLNPQSHHGLNFPVYEKELSEAFKLVDKIKAYPIIQNYVVLHKGVHLRFTHPTEKYTFECIVTSAWTLATKPGGSSMTFPNCRITIWQFEGKEFWDFPNKQIFKNIGNITSSESRLNKILYNLTQISELSINEDMFKKYTLCDGTYTLEKVMKKHKVSLLRKS